jgi:hypothetical protein
MSAFRLEPPSKKAVARITGVLPVVRTPVRVSVPCVPVAADTVGALV